MQVPLPFALLWCILFIAASLCLSLAREVRSAAAPIQGFFCGGPCLQNRLRNVIEISHAPVLAVFRWIVEVVYFGLFILKSGQLVPVVLMAFCVGFD